MKKIACLIPAIILFLGSCEKKICSSPPNEFLFKLNISSNEISGNNIDNFKVYYFKNGVKTYLSDIYWVKEYDNLDISSKNIFLSPMMSSLSGFEKINSFYFEYSSNEIDTLSFVQSKVVENECTYFKTSELTYNTKDLELDKSVLNLKVYKIVK